MIDFQSTYNKAPYHIQSLALNLYSLKLYKQRYGKKFLKVMNELKKTQYYSKEEIDKYQNKQLRKLIEHAYETVPYYRQLFEKNQLKPKDIITNEDLPKIPMLTKRDVKKHHNKLISKIFIKKNLVHGHTSGTTGSPLNFYWDINTCVYTNAVDWRQKEWAGIKHGDPIALFLGRMIVSPGRKKPPFWQKDYLNNQLWMSCFHMNEEYLRYYVTKLKKFKPLAVEGYPSTLYILARYLLSRKMTLPVKAAFTSSETLYEIQRDMIERAFECEVFDFLGMAERVIFATECTYHTGHHLNFEYAINEIVDKNGNPVMEDKPGYIVGTSLQNFAMPFIRYKTDDITSLKKMDCPCGRKMPLIDDVTTKAEDIVVTPDGRMVSSSVLTHPFKPLGSIRESQIIQENIRNITIKIVKGTNYDDNATIQLVAAMQERIGKQIKIDVRFVNKIPRTTSGKLRWVISKVDLPF